MSKKPQMLNNEKLKKVIFWVISQGMAESQEEIAYKLGINPQYLSQVVTGKKPLSTKLAKNFVKIFNNINLDYLLGVSEVMLKSETADNNSGLVNANQSHPGISDLIKAINNISEAALKNADSDKIRAEAELKRAEAEDRNSRNMEELIKLLTSGAKPAETAVSKKEVKVIEK